MPCSGMFRNVPGCSGMFHVPGFIDAHFQVTFQQAGIYVPNVSLRGRRANAHLLVMFNAWTSQRLMNSVFQLVIIANI